MLGVGLDFEGLLIVKSEDIVYKFSGTFRYSMAERVVWKRGYFWPGIAISSTYILLILYDANISVENVDFKVFRPLSGHF